jgi:hypothetical protein
VCGFVHAHGHVDVFGLITLDVDLYVAVCYDSGNVTGTATFTVQVSILFFSESFSLSASYTFAGSGSSSGSASPAASLFSQNSRDLQSGDPAAALPPAAPKPAPVFIRQPAWTEYISYFAV